MNIDWSKAPEGATHWGADNGSFCECFYKQTEGEWKFAAHHTDWQWRDLTTGMDGERLLDLVVDTAKPWSGDGLPPVGTVCEVQRSDLKWYRCTIFAARGDEALFDLDAGHADSWDSADASLFRPIRTPEQIAAEEREAEILGIVKDILPVQGEVTRVIAAHMHAIGYRKPKDGDA